MIDFPTGKYEWSMIASQLPPEKTFRFQRFLRRFRLAYCFDGMKLHFLDQKTIDGYDALFSVFLSYSSYELLWSSISLFYGDESIKEERTKYSIINPTLASRLKQDKILEQFLHLEDKTHPLTQKVDQFFYSNNSDILPLIEAIKDKVMHGYFSIGGMKSDSREHSKDIWDSSRELLVLTEDIFHNFVLCET
jgi:hypothetical protein